MSRIPRCKEPISTEETIKGVMSMIVLVVVSVFFGHLYYVATDPRIAYKGFYTVNEFVHNRTIKNVTFQNNQELVFDFEKTSEQLHIFVHCDKSYCLNKYLKLDFDFNDMIGHGVDGIVFTDNTIGLKPVDFKQTYSRQVYIDYLDPTMGGFIYFDAVIVVNTKVIDRSSFYKDYQYIVRNIIVSDGEIVLRS